jgi:tetratricopeptide (TPR) repeat protein
LAALVRRRGDLVAAASYDREATALPDDPPWPDPFREETDQLRVGHYAWLQQESQLEDQHRFAEAAALYLQETQMKPTPRAYARAGFNLARAGDYERAVMYLREAVRLDPNSAHAHFLFAFTLFVRAEAEWKRSANSPEAREWFRASIEQARRTTQLQPTQAMAYLFWGRALKYLGEPAAAVVPLRQGVECAPENFPLQLTLGEILLEMRQYPEAETHLKNAQKLNPKDPRPDQALQRLRRSAPKSR